MARLNTQKTADVKTAVSNKLTAEQAVIKSIQAVKGTQYTNKQGKVVTKSGCHVVYDGLNAMLRKYFGIENAVDFINGMADKNLIDVRGAKGGAMVYMVGDAPAKTDSNADALFTAISK